MLVRPPATGIGLLHVIVMTKRVFGNAADLSVRSGFGEAHVVAMTKQALGGAE